MNSLILGKMNAMGEKKIVILITTGLLLLTAVFFYTIRDEAENYRSSISKEIMIEQTWQLPKDLKEISGIAFLEKNKLTCVQDEVGVVFVYNLESSKVEKKIPFGQGGDYEGIAVIENTIYVLESNGTIYRINNIKDKPKVEKFKLPFTAKNNLEGLFFDALEKRLLISVKERDLNSKDYKGIYSLDPRTMKINEEPVYKMTFKESIFKNKNNKNKKVAGTFFPSEINRDPKSGEILVLEAREPKLLILDSRGTPKTLHRLDRKFFPQPEGLAFDNSGKLYISNEGEPGMIHRVTFKQK